MERLNKVIESATTLNKVFGIGSTSCELIPIYVNPDAPFDPTTMDDAFRASTEKVDVERAEPENVLCSTDLGLLRAERGEGKPPDFQWTKMILLRPKIVLQSRLDEITAASDESP
jgi:hypothetical protein